MLIGCVKAGVLRVGVALSELVPGGVAAADREARGRVHLVLREPGDGHHDRHHALLRLPPVRDHGRSAQPNRGPQERPLLLREQPRHRRLHRLPHLGRATRRLVHYRHPRTISLNNQQ